MLFWETCYNLEVFRLIVGYTNNMPTNHAIAHVQNKKIDKQKEISEYLYKKMQKFEIKYDKAIFNKPIELGFGSDFKFFWKN